MVKVLIFGQTLRDCVDETDIECPLDGATTVRQLLERHPAYFANLMPFFESSQVLITVNQKVSTLETSIKPGDTLKLTHQFNPEFEGTLWHNP